MNPSLEIFFELQGRFQQNKEDEAIGKYAALLLSYAFLAENPEPRKFYRLVVELTLKTM